MKGPDHRGNSGAPPAPWDVGVWPPGGSLARRQRPGMHPQGAPRRQMPEASATRRNTAGRPGRGVPPGCPGAGRLRRWPSSECCLHAVVGPPGIRTGPGGNAPGALGGPSPYPARPAQSARPRPIFERGSSVPSRKFAGDGVASGHFAGKAMRLASCGLWPRKPSGCPPWPRQAPLRERCWARRSSHGCWPSKLHVFASRAASVCSNPRGPYRGRRGDASPGPPTRSVASRISPRISNSPH